VRARVKETREVAKGTLLAIFDLQGEEVDFRPGQYFWVELLDSPYEDERGLRRHITIVTSPTERGVLGLCTRLRDTAFKKTLAELQVGDEIEVEEPKGEWALPEDTSPSYVFVAGGIGITPYRSMLRYIADTGSPYRVTLVYSNRDVESTAFLDELEELESVVPRCRVIFTMTEDPNWDGDTRMLDADVLGDLLGDLESYHFMVAGPPPMAKSVEASLLEAGLTEDQVQSDSFSGY